MLALSSATLMGVSVPAVRSGASFTAVTVTGRFSVSVWAGVPLSVTVHVTLLPVPLTLASVLYFSPWSSAAVSGAFTDTAVVPSALNNCT